jgi:hypothetical protein
VLAEKQLTEAAKASELRQRAEASTRSVLQSIASGLGYKNVSVVFE